MDCLNYHYTVYYVLAKLCNQMKIFSHDVEMNNKDILHFTLTSTDRLKENYSIDIIPYTL